MRFLCLPVRCEIILERLYPLDYIYNTNDAFNSLLGLLLWNHRYGVLVKGFYTIYYHKLAIQFVFDSIQVRDVDKLQKWWNIDIRHSWIRSEASCLPCLRLRIYLKHNCTSNKVIDNLEDFSFLFSSYLLPVVGYTWNLYFFTPNLYQCRWSSGMLSENVHLLSSCTSISFDQ